MSTGEPTPEEAVTEGQEEVVEASVEANAAEEVKRIKALKSGEMHPDGSVMTNERSKFGLMSQK